MGVSQPEYFRMDTTLDITSCIVQQLQSSGCHVLLFLGSAACRIARDTENHGVKAIHPCCNSSEDKRDIAPTEYSK